MISYEYVVLIPSAWHGIPQEYQTWWDSNEIIDWLGCCYSLIIYLHLSCIYNLNRFLHLFKHGNGAKYMTWAILLPIAIPGATFLDALYANNLMDLIVWTPEHPCNQYKPWILNKFHWISTNQIKTNSDRKAVWHCWCYGGSRIWRFSSKNHWIRLRINSAHFLSTSSLQGFKSWNLGINSHLFTRPNL